MKSLQLATLLPLLFFIAGNSILADITLYRAKANLPSQAVNANIFAIGTASGAAGGTTYVEERLLSSVDVAYNSPPITSLITAVRTETTTFVEAAFWVYMSNPDDSGKFNSVEQNCTFEGSQETAVCVQINKEVVNDTSTTLTIVSATTHTRKMVPVYTVTGLFPAQTQSINSAGVRMGPEGFSFWLVTSGLAVMMLG